MISPIYEINPAQAEKSYFFPYLFQGLNDVIMSDNPQEQGITVAQFDEYLSVEPTRS